jgi:transcriptional regulator with XRE-family HTH domain
MGIQFGNRIIQTRKEKKISREELARKVGTSIAMIGRYEREEMMPSIEIAFKIAQALDVSLDFLMGNTSIIATDKKILSRLENITALPSNKQEELFNVIDAYLRDFNTSKAYKE